MAPNARQKMVDPLMNPVGRASSRALIPAHWSGIKSLILSAGCDLLFCQGSEESHQFLFTGQRSRKLSDIAVITPEPGAVTLLGFGQQDDCVERLRPFFEVHLEYLQPHSNIRTVLRICIRYKI